MDRVVAINGCQSPCASCGAPYLILHSDKCTGGTHLLISLEGYALLTVYRDWLNGTDARSRHGHVVRRALKSMGIELDTISGAK